MSMLKTHFVFATGRHFRSIADFCRRRSLFRVLSLVVISSWLAMPGDIHAQRNLTDIPDPDPEIERATFVLPDGFEVNLFAADPAIAKPIHMNFDPQGRLWIASSEIYPHIKPGEKANDRILIVEDTDQDGTADKTSVFAGGLLIPTGVLPGDGGAYVANSTELLHLADTDNDGKADRERVVLSGFGTEDTHHILHTLRWGPDGLLYMNQSIYIHSHIETPWGVRRLNAGGIWQFRPENMKLDVFARGWVNTWGHQFDEYGQSFVTDGAGGEGINYAIPGAAYPTAQGVPRIFHGLNPGSPKYCGLEIVGGGHLPDDWEGSLITNDFRGNRVCRFVVSEDGAGYAAREQVEVIRSTHVAFRPIDVKLGPDGAIYIADWYNPIIQHGEVDFRDERRDHVHGRIWRVTYGKRPVLKYPQLPTAPLGTALAGLTSPNRWTRESARRVLKETGAKIVLPELAAMEEALDRQAAEQGRQSDDAGAMPVDRHRLEVLWMHQAFDTVNRPLLVDLLRSSVPQVRAAATRVVQHWFDRLPDGLELLTERISDEHPRVRLEAVRALGNVGSPQAVEIAMRALDMPVDRFLDYALWLTAWETRDAWLPLVEQGQLTFGGRSDHLTFALSAVGSPTVVPRMLSLLQDGSLTGDRFRDAVSLVLNTGSAEQFQQLLDLAGRSEDAQQQFDILQQMMTVSRQRKLRPAGDLAVIGTLLGSSSSVSVQASAAAASGQWKLTQHGDRLRELAVSTDAAVELRTAALLGLGDLADDASLQTLRQVSDSQQSFADRQTAIIALAQSRAGEAVVLAVDLMAAAGPDDDPGLVVAAFLSRQRGPELLSKALASKTIPADAAKLAIRMVESSGQQAPELTAALAAAGSIQTGARKLSPEEMSAFVAEVAGSGSVQRGEQIFRRASLACLKCHAIGGAGGRVGPDLASIGGSAPVDYVVDSLLDPNSKVKEGYHTIIAITDDGKTVSGIKVRQTDTHLILRNAEDQETAVPLAAIEEQVNGISLMPTGLTERLTRQELVDLVRFLSVLGKVDGLKIGRERVVRRWQVLQPTPEAEFHLRRTRLGSVTDEVPAFAWTSAYSQVDGQLPLNELPIMPFREPFKPEPKQLVFARFDLDVSTAGTVELLFNSLDGLTVWLDGAPLEADSTTTRLELEQGSHRITLAIDTQARSIPLQATINDVENSPAQVQIISGR